MICRAFKFMLFASALAVGGIIAWGVMRESVEGSGVSASEERSVGAVSEVSLSGVGNLTLIQGDVPALSVTADDNILPLLETETSGQKLTIRTKSGFSLRPKTPISYTLTVPKLEKASISGSGNIKADKLTGDALTFRISGSGNASLREVACKSLSLSISGSGNATLGGTAETLTTQISGSGDIDAASLQTKSADIRVSGSGNASVWATNELKVRVSGAGDVKYKGNPKLDRKISGSGKVRAMD